MMKQNVVLYPGLGTGHLNPMMELAKLFLRHDLAVTIVCIEPPRQPDAFRATISDLSASNPAISFHILPPITLDFSAANPFLAMMGRYNDPLCDLLRSLPSVRALVLDMFCSDALAVAAELGIPAYFFYASGGADLAAFLYLPHLDATMDTPFGELGKKNIEFPGVAPLPASHLPKELMQRGDIYHMMIQTCTKFAEAKGILVNTFESLEMNALKAIRDGLCVPGRVMPPVYFIGPLVADRKEEKHECLLWLDEQPEKSVVFLSFGSMGTFAKEQLREIAIGLDKSGQRFLWVVRSPRDPDPRKFFEALPEPDLEALLPEGFMERTKGRGMVVKSWAPQVDVLQHKATGAFVTHCGWNSAMEGLMAGLPLVCWPLYAEQMMNKVFLVEDMKVGMELEGYDGEMVRAEEVELKVRMVMESEEGRKLREQAATMKVEAAKALKEGGSSYVALLEFLKDLEN